MKLKIKNNMSKNNAVKVLEGAAAGIVLGVAASMFLSSKKGKEIKKDITDVMANFYKYVSPKVKKIKKIGENEYKDFMKNAAEKYAKGKQISQETTAQLIKDAQDSWKHLSDNLSK